MLVFSLVFAAAFAAAVPVALAVTVEIAPSSDGDRTVQIAAAERRNGHVGLRFDGTGALASILENATGRELVGEKCPFMDVTLGDGRIFPSTGMREAVDDVRYATLLLRLCRERPDSPVSKEALAWLDAIDVMQYSYDPVETRSKMVEFILRLLPVSPGA